ncbi:hypothetical protein N7501_000526, partial [Penicillium viridicatum]
MNEQQTRGVFRGTANGYRAQMLSHDFIKGLARELAFDLGGHRVYGMTFSNWVCTNHLLRDPAPALSRGGYGEMAVERVGERKKRRRREEVEEGWMPIYTPKNMRTFPKWTVPLHLP